ncbi:MAG: heme NO-binding domain-containing protein [Bacteroidota bacterium]|nr:heme NO-binding domain-containing protein [Bacteroidota bacterium]
MKGIIFTEFLELVEEKFGLSMVDTIINESELESQGIYTSVGTYEFSEMLQLITHLSKNTNISVDDLLLVYAEHLFAAFINMHPNIVEHYKDPMDLVASIENHIHVEVKKIYPEAQLPTFEIQEKNSDSMKIIYKSDKALYMLCKGLMTETFKLFKTPVNIEFYKLNELGTEVRFDISYA